MLIKYGNGNQIFVNNVQNVVIYTFIMTKSLYLQSFNDWISNNKSPVFLLKSKTEDAKPLINILRLTSISCLLDG